MVEIKAPPVTKGSVGVLSQLFATVLVLAATAVVAFAFAMEHWQEVTLKEYRLLDQWATKAPTSAGNDIANKLRSALLDEPLFTTHSRGVFETCYDILNSTYTRWPYFAPYNGLMIGSGLNGGNSCVAEQGYEINPRPESANFGQFYQLRIQLMRCHFAFLCAALVCTVASALTNAIGCCCMRIRLLMTASVLAFGGTMFAAGAIAFWHAIMYVEYTKIDAPGFFFYYYSRPIIYQMFLNAMSVTFGYCYILAWVGVGTSLFAAILYLLAAVKITGALKDADERALQLEDEAAGIPPLRKEDPKEKERKAKEEKAKKEKEEKERKEREEREKKEKEERERKEREEKEEKERRALECQVAALTAAYCCHPGYPAPPPPHAPSSVSAYYYGGGGACGAPEAYLPNYNYAAYPQNPYAYNMPTYVVPVPAVSQQEVVIEEVVNDDDEDEVEEAEEDEDVEESEEDDDN